MFQPLESRHLLSTTGPSIGDLDFSFGDHGRIWSILNSRTFPADVAVRGNGDILVAAATDDPGLDVPPGTRSDLLLLEYAPDGSGMGGNHIAFTTSVGARDMAFQADGKILVVGAAYGEGSDPPISFVVARFNADLTPDASFGMGGAVTTAFTSRVIPHAVAQAPDGRIVVAGTALGANGPDHLAVAVYHADGSRDTSFDGDGKKLLDLGASPTGAGSTFDRFKGLAITSDNKIVLAAESDLFNTATNRYDGDAGIRAGLLRLNTNGTTDATFGAGSGGSPTYVLLPSAAQVSIDGFAVQPDGKYLLAISSNDGYEPTGWRVSFTRFTAGGAMDVAPTNPQDIGGQAGQIIFRPDGNFYSGGLNLFSTNFSLLAHASTELGGTMALQPDGKIVFLSEIQTVGGTEDFITSTHDVRLARYEGASTTAEHVFGHASYNDLAMDTASRVYAAWYDTDAKSLNYAVRDKAGVWSDTQIIDADSSDVGKFVSIALDAQGLPSVAYQDSASADLKYAHFNGRRWVRQSIDTAGNTGLWTSLAFDRNGAPGISYYDKTHGDLRLAVARGRRWSLTTIDAQGDTGRYTNLAIDPTTARWAIAYEQSSTGQVRYARQRPGGKWERNIAADTQSRAQYLSLAYDANDHPAISYYDLHENSLALAGVSRRDKWYAYTIASGAGAGTFSNILFGSPDAAANFGFGPGSEFIYYSAADNHLTAAFAGDGEQVDSIINVRLSGNTGGTYATAVTRPYRNGHATGYNANALAWIDADGNLVVQGP